MLLVLSDLIQNPVSMKDIRTLGEEICKMDVEAVRTKYPVVANGDATDLCFDLSFIYKHLSEGIPHPQPPPLPFPQPPSSSPPPTPRPVVSTTPMRDSLVSESRKKKKKGIR